MDHSLSLRKIRRDLDKWWTVHPIECNKQRWIDFAMLGRHVEFLDHVIIIRFLIVRQVPNVLE